MKERKAKQQFPEKMVAINFFTLDYSRSYTANAISLIKDIGEMLCESFPEIESELTFHYTMPLQEGEYFLKGDYLAWSSIKDSILEMTEQLKGAWYYGLNTPGNSRYPQEQRFNLFCRQHNDDETSKGRIPIVGITLNMWPSIYRQLFSADPVALCKRIATMLPAVGGYMEYTGYFNQAGYGTTPMQDLCDAELKYHETHFAELVPGYTWGVLLTEEHIRRLGGKEIVLRDAPCYKKHEWAIDGKDAIFLQLTEDIFDVTDAQRLELKRFLEPVMLPVDPLIAAVNETVYEKLRLRLDNVVFSPEEREAIDELERKYKPMELNEMLVGRNVERMKQAGTYVPRKTKKEQREALWQELKTVISISLKKD